jgi:hypothetical protein
MNAPDIAAQADALEGIRQGIEDVKKGRVRLAREALELFRRKHAIPRSADHRALLDTAVIYEFH